MAMSARNFDFKRLLSKFIEDQGINSEAVNASIVTFSKKHKENCVLVLQELQQMTALNNQLNTLQGEQS